MAGKEPSLYIRGAFERHRAALDASLTEIMPDVERAALAITETLARGGTIYTCGNGGSAADAQHFAAEWVCKYRDSRSSLPAHALSTDTSAITAIGNDFGFDEIFARPLQALAKPKDILVAFTTSGASKNILRAIEVAREKKIYTIVLTGMRGAHLKDQVDCTIAIPSEETARIQEMHELIYHAWCEYADAVTIL